MLALPGESGKPLPVWPPCYQAGSSTMASSPPAQPSSISIAETDSCDRGNMQDLFYIPRAGFWDCATLGFA